MNTAEPTLYVDLDGTLVSTDMLYESFLSAFKSSPWVALQCVGWTLQGRARLKEQLAARASIDVATLPYRQSVIEFLREERARGRRIVLTTASWGTLAEAVSRHLGVFDEVMATSREGNLKGEAKAARIVEHCAGECFDYIGDSAADLAVWRRSRNAYIVEPVDRLAKRVPGHVTVKRVFRPDDAGGKAGAMIRALRPHQWAKNLLLFLPLLASHRFDDAGSVAAAFFGFAAFSLLASGAYILNDLLDLEADRAHPRKRRRPFASGALSIPAGMALGIATFAAGIAVSFLLPALFQAALAAYFLLTLAYSLGLKRVVMLDVISLASLYTIRIVAGTFAISVALSFWLLGFSMFLFFSLALVKRYAELLALENEGIAKAPGRGYGGHDADIVLAIGTASAMVSALVLALYVNGETAKNLYSHPPILWLLCPVFLYWISRMWLLASRGQMHEDPVLFAVRDRTSYIVAAVAVAIGFAAI